ncbi:MAG TPA: CAP domain-containing protein [Methylomirabilota bacterium]|nr:CAP domain-containing protein [Methylomirabilota bacterium]
MGLRMRLVICVLALALGNALQAAVQQAEVTWATFQQAPAAQARINLTKIDTNLLNAAVFHATNAEREKAGLPLLKYHQGAAAAAAIQSRIMNTRGTISHDNPENPRFRTLGDRAKAAGLNFRYLAENVAVVFGRDYESGRGFYVREEQGKKVLSYTPEGEAIQPHTYAGFAANLVKNWMNSPGHRANILRTDPQCLGVSCHPEKDRTGLVKIFCTQVFFTPLPRS